MKTILVPTDLSKSSENAFKYAAEIARETKAHIILFHVYETPVVYTDVTVASIPLDFGALREDALKKLHKFFGKVVPYAKGIHVHLAVDQGLPSSRIVELASEKKADLVMMASSSLGPVQKFFLGSNTTRVIRDSHCMVMIIPPKATYNSFKTIVFATDLTAQNLDSSIAVVEFARLFKSTLKYMNVDNHFIVHDDDDLSKITQNIKKHVKYPKLEGYVTTDVKISDGIRYFLKSHKADLLALSTHHRGFLRSFIDPSITTKVAAKANIPLLVTHQDQ